MLGTTSTFRDYASGQVLGRLFKGPAERFVDEYGSGTFRSVERFCDEGGVSIASEFALYSVL